MDDGMRSRRNGPGAKREPADGEDAKKGKTKTGKAYTNPNDSAYRRQLRKEVTDGACEKFLANLAAIAILAVVLYPLIYFKII
jgi:hypothetical protein